MHKLSREKKCYNFPRGFRRFAAPVLALLLLCLQAFPMQCFASEDADSAGIRMESGTFEEDETVSAEFYDSDEDRTIRFSVPYSDAFFARDPDVFYMDMAQASYGLAISAFRDTEDDETPSDQNAVTFLEEIGFEDHESFCYDEEPASDTIASVIASKTVGDATVIAFVCCGANYGDEWAGNLAIGNGYEHEGFSGAASICADRLMDYIEEHDISGDIRLWIAGYSRASAVGNCLAARMTESGLFSSVYGYFYATPNNTREPVAYSNLFNIVSQNDSVPQIPASCWGYGRNGVDLYLPAQESNYDYYDAFSSADEVYTALQNKSFHNNPELNWQLYVIKEFVCAIFPTVNDFTEQLQTELVSIIETDDTLDMLSALKEALGNIDDLTAEQQEGVDALTEYLDMVIYEYVSGNYTQISDGSWSTEDSPAHNLFFEHLAVVYGSWLFSTEDPSALFEENTQTLHLVIKGSFDLEVWDSYGLVQSVSCGNEEAVYEPGSESRAADADEVYLYATNHDGSAVISIPADREFTLKLYPNETGDIAMFSDKHSYESVSFASDIMLFHAQVGQCVVISDLFASDGMQICTENGEEFAVLRQSMPEGIRSLIAREKLANDSFTVKQVLFAIAFFLLMPVLLMLAALIGFCRGRRRHRTKPGIFVTVCLCLLVPVLAAGAVIFRRLLPNIRTAAIVYAALAVLAAVLLVLRLMQHFRRHDRAIQG